MEIYPRHEERMHKQHMLLMKEWKRDCPHQRVLWGADGETGFCFRCGATVKREVN